MFVEEINGVAFEVVDLVAARAFAASAAMPLFVDTSRPEYEEIIVVPARRWDGACPMRRYAIQREPDGAGYLANDLGEHDSFGTIEHERWKLVASLDEAVRLLFRWREGVE